MDNAVQNFKDSLKKSGLKEVSSPERCDFILFFCPITSRTGTNIDAAVNYLNEVNKAPKPVSMVVLHHTFEPEKIIPDSNPNIKEEHISAVDCLFYDLGLLECQKNTNAISTIETDSKSKKWTSYYCLKKDQGHPCPSTNQDAEDQPLVDEQNTRENRGTDEDHGCLWSCCAVVCCYSFWNKKCNCHFEL